jgi:2-oxoglutarate ferredoxin oxidoreductase subunit alpha
LGQMVQEVDRAVGGQAKTYLVPHAGGSVHRPEDILKAIVEANR